MYNQSLYLVTLMFIVILFIHNTVYYYLIFLIEKIINIILHKKN
jgi:hypothetical protein